MSPEAPGNLIVIDLRFEDGELKGESQSVEYSQEQTEKIEAAGGWFMVLWNETPRGKGASPIGGGVVYVQDLPAGYKIGQPSPVVPDSLGGNRWKYRYPALGEGLMFVLVLPEGYTLFSPKPMPKSAKVFNDNRLAVYWKPHGKYGADVKITWGLKKSDVDIKVERDQINSEIEKSENVPDNPGATVDPDQGLSASGTATTAAPKSDIFISYKREEQPIAKKLADALKSKGWSVWWDPELRAGERVDDVIEKALIDAKCVIVMWSKLSVQSSYVKDEASYALDNDKLVPIAIEEVELPFRFKGIQTRQLYNWDGSDSFPEFGKLVDNITSILDSPPIEVKEAEQSRKGQVPKKPAIKIGIMIALFVVICVGATWLFWQKLVKSTFDSSSSGAGYDVKYSGTAHGGKGALDAGATRFDLNLHIAGAEVTGEYSDATGDTGTLQLKIVGNSLVGDVVSNGPGGRCSWRGTLSMDGSKLDATYHCPDGERGDLSLVRK